MMQAHGGQAAHEAILAPERTFVVDLKIDWHGDGLYLHDLSDVSPAVGSISVDRSLAGSLPSELMLVEGSSAAELTFTLGGDIPPGVWSTGATDRWMSWVSILSPYNGLSPLYQARTIGAEVKYRLGLQTAIGTIWYPQFVGNIRTIQVNRSSHTVTITALDRSEKMRQPVDLPLWAIASWHADRGYQKAQLTWSHWVIDQCLRSADVSTTPYRPVFEEEGKAAWPHDNEWGLQFYLTGNGSYIPTVGVMGDARVQGFPWTEGGGGEMYSQTGLPHPDVAAEVNASGPKPFALNDLLGNTSGAVPRLLPQSPATSDTDAARAFNLLYRCRDVPEMKGNADGTHYLGFTMLTPPGDDGWKTADVYPLEVFIGGNRTIRIRVNAHSVRGEIWNWTTNTRLWGGSWVAIPSGQTSVEIGVQVYGPFDDTMKIGARAGSNFSGWATTADATLFPLPEDNREGVVRVKHEVQMQDIFWAVRFLAEDDISAYNFETYARRPARYAAVLDPGLNGLTSTPSTSYEDAWALASSVAAAELGAIFWDENGVFRFWNRDRIVGLQQNPVRSLTLDEVGDLGMTNSSDSIRNIVSLDAIVATADQGNVFQSSDPDQFYLAPGTAVATQIEISDNSIQSVTPGKVRRFATTPDANVPFQWTENTYHGYVVEFTSTPQNPDSWTEKNHFVSGVDVFAYANSKGQLTITFHNGYTEHARFSKLHIGGTKITKQANRIVRWEDQDSIYDFGPRNLQVAGDWVQFQPASIQRLGDYLIQRTSESIPATDAIAIAGDPRLQLGDTIVVWDPDGMGEELRLQVLGINRSFTKESGLVDTLTVELTRPSEVGIWDSSQYGRWDQTFIWS